MKRLFLSILFCIPFLAQANFSDDLEKAIRDSDADQVKTLLPQVDFSDHEQACLVDLAQQMIFYRKGQIECYQLGFINRVSHPRVVIEKFDPKYFLWFITGIVLFSIAEAKKGAPLSKGVEVGAFLTGGFCLSTFFVHAFSIGKQSIQALKKLPEVLKEDFDNALAVKQLLLRYKPSQ